MKIAILSDIHSNLQALEAVIEDCQKQQVDHIWCLGDIIGYGSNPWECWKALQKAAEPGKILMGNHEFSLENDEELNKFTSYVKAGINYAKKQLDQPKNKALSKQIASGLFTSLPLTLHLKEFDVALAHSDFVSPASWSYVESSIDAQEQVNALPARINFLGHTHKPFVFRNKNCGIIDRHPNHLLLESDYKYLINPGSVGQPRDKDYRASYAIFEIADGQKYISVHRLNYDVKKTARLIKRAGLPDRIAERLLEGR